MVVKCILDKRRKTSDGMYPVKIRIAHQFETVYYGLSIKSDESEFDARTGLFYTDNKITKNINTRYNQIILFHIQKCNDIIFDCMKNNESLTAIKLKELLSPDKETKVRISTRQEVIQKSKEPITIQKCFELSMQNKIGRTKEAYISTLHKINSLYGDCVPVNDIDEQWLNNFNTKMATTPSIRAGRTIDGLSVNGRSIHFKMLRSVFNDAIKNKIVPQDNYPFKFFKIETV